MDSCRLPSVVLTLALIVLPLAGCRSVQTLSGDGLHQVSAEAMANPFEPDWYYLGSDTRYHYLARDGDTRPSYRVPRHELPIDRPYAYDRTRAQRLLLQRQAPTLYPWERRLRPHPADLTERWGPTIDDPRPDVRHDPYGPILRRSPPARERR